MDHDVTSDLREREVGAENFVELGNAGCTRFAQKLLCRSLHALPDQGRICGCWIGGLRIEWPDRRVLSILQESLVGLTAHACTLQPDVVQAVSTVVAGWPPDTATDSQAA